MNHNSVANLGLHAEQSFQEEIVAQNEEDLPHAYRHMTPQNAQRPLKYWNSNMQGIGLMTPWYSIYAIHPQALELMSSSWALLMEFWQFIRKYNPKLNVLLFFINLCIMLVQY